jgi:opacity protein-like surface antigen
MARTAHLLTATFVTSMLSLALVAEADAAPNVKGANNKRFRLHIDTSVFDFTHFNADGGSDDPDIDEDDEYNTIGFGPGRPIRTDGSTVDGFGGGLHPRPLLGIGFGYVFLGDRAIVGGRVALSVDGVGLGGRRGRGTLVSGLLTPYFHWMFLPGRWVRPYVEGRFGFGGGTVTTHDDLDGDDEDDDTSTIHILYPQFGVGGGIHLFPVEYFSVDLGLDLDYVAPHTRVTSNVEGFDDTEWDKAGDAVVLGIRAGLSVFF